MAELEPRTLWSTLYATIINIVDSITFIVIIIFVVVIEVV